jgi:nitrate reductase gamma subunit
MTLLATPLINTSALWKIILAAVAGGAGVVIAFGLVLLGLSRAKRASGSTQRMADYALSGLAGLFCVAAVVLGIYAMVKKPATAKPKAKPAAAITSVIRST